ncbi:MAG: phosphopentomutase [Lachnospirales bacterium]
MKKRAIIIVLDAVGIGELPDAKDYGDEGSNTLMHTKEAYPSLNLKNMEKLGLGNIEGYNVYKKEENPIGIYGKMAEKSKGKDTTTGHWEIAGLYLSKPFPTYPNGFPKEIIEEFENKIGRKVIGNKVASGTVIINELGDLHIKTKSPIVYTSADSVFQIAAHEDIIPVETLYKYCQIARDMLDVGRVIARPFVGENGNYKRTVNRKDFSLEPIGKTILDYVKESGLEVNAVGKIEDIFCNRGITNSVHTHTNEEGIEQTIKYINEANDGLIFTNLVDTDMLYGHRNDVEGFAKSLQYFDDNLPRIIDAMTDEDLLFVTADHGCDPTTPSTDHSREYVFLLGYGKNIKPKNIGVRKTYADLGKTVLDFLNIENNIDAEIF